MKKHLILLAAVATVHTAAWGGIYRHDKKESEYVALGAQPQFDCVGQVMHEGKMGGSCVLIGKRFVLSAAHVFVLADHRDKTINDKGQTITINEPYNRHIGGAGEYVVVFKGKEYKCKAVTAYPRYLDTTTKDGLDIALLELQTPINDIEPAKLNKRFDELHAEVTGAGWGVRGEANKPAEIIREDPKKLGGENMIDSLGGYVLNNEATGMFCDFDYEADSSCNKLGDAKARELEYLCGGGDSGGGLFRQTNAGWELIGICHGASVNVNQLMKTGYYGQVMYWTRVSVFANWIAEQMSGKGE